jgi:hypothetical protein
VRGAKDTRFTLGREINVQVQKQTVAAALRRQGDHDRAQQAECSLPRQVDTERDAGLLHLLDVDLDALTETDET